MSPAPYNDVTVLNTARRRAQRTRGTHLYSVVEGMSSIWDVLDAATQPEGIPLRKLTLPRLLAAQPGWGPVRVERLLTQMSDLCGMNVPGQSEMTIGWMLDTRAGGRRFEALVDAMSRVDESGREVVTTTPWPGFPYGRVPMSVRAGGAHE